MSTDPRDIIHGWRLVSRTTTLISLGVAARGEATLALHTQGQGGLFIACQYNTLMQKLSHSGWRVDPTNGLLFCHWICHHQTMINVFKTWDWVWKGYVGLKSHQAPNISQNFVPRTLFPNGYITERYMGEDDKQYEGRSPSVEGIKTQKHNHT